MTTLTNSKVREIIENHIHAMLREIQGGLGVKTGDLAGVMVDLDNLKADIEFNLRPYLKAECSEAGWRYDESG